MVMDDAVENAIHKPAMLLSRARQLASDFFEGNAGKGADLRTQGAKTDVSEGTTDAGSNRKKSS